MDRNLSRFPRFLLLLAFFLQACNSAQVVQQLDTPAPASAPTAREIPTGLSSPAPVVSTKPAVCNEKIGSLAAGVINTSLLDKPMRYSVYLPPCYAFDTNKRYPVLYLLHGQGFTEDQWIRIGAAATADRLVASGQIAPVIMVFPYDHSYKQPSEYKFEDVFIQQLIPDIDSGYRTQANAPQRAIGGLSRGGAWALHIGARYPHLFGAIGGHSPSIFVVDEKALPRSLLAIPASQIPRIWLDAGDSDSEYAVIQPFEEFLSENNIPHEWHSYVGWHDEKYWSAHMDRYLIWYAQDWR